MSSAEREHHIQTLKETTPQFHSNPNLLHPHTTTTPTNVSNINYLLNDKTNILEDQNETESPFILFQDCY